MREWTIGATGSIPSFRAKIKPEAEEAQDQVKKYQKPKAPRASPTQRGIGH